MTNEERILKLKQAESLIREVEFSYPIGDRIRQELYRGVVNSFGFLGSFTAAMQWIKTDIEIDRKGLKAKGEYQRECPYEIKDFESCPQCKGSFSLNKPSGAACPHCKVNIIDAYCNSDTV